MIDKFIYVKIKTPLSQTTPPPLFKKKQNKTGTNTDR